jgi:hypothetical protein
VNFLKRRDSFLGIPTYRTSPVPTTSAAPKYDDIPTMTRSARHSQCACNPAITCAQSPKFVTP